MKTRSPLVPLGTLISRELRHGNVEKPTVNYGQAGLAKKGDDYFLIKPDCQRICGDPLTSFSVFAIFDGHNGISAAIFAKENLLNNTLSAIPQGCDREEWLQALPRALVAGFVGPLHCWPGELCLSRSIGDTDVGEFIVPIPHVKQVKLSNSGGRLIIASDGIWDALSSEMAAHCCRGLPADLAAKLEALRSRGLKDDTTCVVVDIIPYGYPAIPQTPKKKQNLLTSLIPGKRFNNSLNEEPNKLPAVGTVEELFEEGSAMLAERLGKDLHLNSNSGTFRCAVCQGNEAPNDDLSGTIFSPSPGPMLCSKCRRKKDAMEGKKGKCSYIGGINLQVNTNTFFHWHLAV
ncbi:hypothetical protein L1987_85594 [Smallanthus sonchifolius]|uniref:Uncharacterized protein n=1 Tax=Smallanthus sonchifolius TaxID=185202 RepID=A0ACB8XX05_9ASTR|nr:hypothetical protein L1987_85594 [Smallanthus sonchifolius]